MGGRLVRRRAHAGDRGTRTRCAGRVDRLLDARIEVRADGRLAVGETIRYNFGAGQRHGIFRKIPARYRWDSTRDRIYPIEDITVTMDGRPAEFIHYAEGGYEVIRVGDPNTTVTGTHSYVIGYTLRGAPR